MINPKKLNVLICVLAIALNIVHSFDFLNPTEGKICRTFTLYFYTSVHLSLTSVEVCQSVENKAIYACRNWNFTDHLGNRIPIDGGAVEFFIPAKNRTLEQFKAEAIKCEEIVVEGKFIVMENMKFIRAEVLCTFRISSQWNRWTSNKNWNSAGKYSTDTEVCTRDYWYHYKASKIVEEVL